MKRGLYFLLSVLVLVVFVAAEESKTDVIFGQGDNITVGGRYVKFLYATNNSAVFRVDAFNVLAYYNITKNFHGVRFKVKEVYGENLILADVTAYQICGDNKCDIDEYCCRDCNCDSGLSCISNQCVANNTATCLADAECNDNNACTIDRCIGYPLKCVIEPINKCQNNDNCCPSSCNLTTDMDCSKCNPTDCIINETCIIQGTIMNESYCYNKTLNLLKGFNSSCSHDFECAGGKCQNETCTLFQNTTKTTLPKMKFPIEKYNILMNILKDKNNRIILLMIVIVIVLVYVRFEIVRKKLAQEIIEKRTKEKSQQNKNGDRGI